MDSLPHWDVIDADEPHLVRGCCRNMTQGASAWQDRQDKQDKQPLVEPSLATWSAWPCPISTIDEHGRADDR